MTAVEAQAAFAAAHVGGKPFQRLALIGVGLIGCSAAAAWKRAGAVRTVVGFDTNPLACAEAIAAHIVDLAATSVAEAVADADLVVLAVPVGAMRSVLDDVAAVVPPFAVITDVGSTKRSVIADARAALTANSSFSLRRFVPAHPIAGRERHGVEHADATLFRDRAVVITPIDVTHPAAIERVEWLWQVAGAVVTRMDADEHDRIFAAVSHLPHLLAFALVELLATADGGARSLQFAGSGFRDFTRIAGSSPAMWRDIMLANRDAVSEMLRAYRGRLDELLQLLERGDAQALERIFEVASRARRSGNFDR